MSKSTIKNPNKNNSPKKATGGSKEKLTEKDKLFLLRFSKMLIDTGLTEQRIGEVLNVAQSKAHRLKKGDTDAQMTTIFRFFQEFPHYSTRYLLLGDGHMKKEINPKVLSEVNNENIKDLKLSLLDLEKRVGKLEKKRR